MRQAGLETKSGGFTLLEVLLAFVIFALSFAVIMQILSGSMRSTTRAKTYTEAALFAQSLVDMVGVDIPLQEGNLSGEAPGGYNWELSISTYQPPFAEDPILQLAEVSGTALYWIDLDVEWANGNRSKQVHFSTVRSALGGQQ
ncbi:MAG: general secretion pathway protein I [Lysobacterales bacterium]|jgi:general secretion pathway protein I